MSEHLSKRLLLIASYVRADSSVCDIGTDHALLPCFLVKQGHKCVIASDINEGPLKMAEETIKQQGVSGITLIKSDGLKNISPCDDIIIAGMGGELISDIIFACNWINSDTRLILQPMTKAEVLRKNLYENGFEIIEEKAVFDAGKDYTVMLVCFMGDKKTVSEVFCFFGKNKDLSYIKSVIKRLEKMAIGNPDYLKIIGEFNESN